MTQVAKQQELTDTWITDLEESLRGAPSSPGVLPIIRRKLRTLTRACGYQRASATFLADLEKKLARCEIHSDPTLTNPGLRQDDWILFSTGPFPADTLFFSKEKDLQGFVEACLGNGPLRNFEPFRENGRLAAHEYRLPSGNRIDLLCQERAKSGSGALVAIELKRDHQKGTVEQMVSYLDELKARFPKREVRGIIISGREDQVASARLRELRGYRVDWLCYRVTLAQIASSV